MKVRLVTVLALFILAAAPVSLLAQTSQASQGSQGACCPQPTCPSPCPQTGTPSGGGFMGDVSPYGGFVWPGTMSGEIGKFKNNQVLGVKGGFFVTSGLEIGGNYYWNNHFQPKSSNEAASLAGALGFPQASARANLWEAEFTYHFG